MTYYIRTQASNTIPFLYHAFWSSLNAVSPTHTSHTALYIVPFQKYILRLLVLIVWVLSTSSVIAILPLTLQQNICRLVPFRIVVDSCLNNILLCLYFKAVYLTVKSAKSHLFSTGRFFSKVVFNEYLYYLMFYLITLITLYNDYCWLTLKHLSIVHPSDRKSR